jgi:hypothetical protein
MSHQERNKRLMQQIVGHTTRIMACKCSSAIVPRRRRTLIDSCQLLPDFSMAPKLTRVTAPSPILRQSLRFAELKRWQPLLLTLSRSTTSTTGSSRQHRAGIQRLPHPRSRRAGRAGDRARARSRVRHPPLARKNESNAVYKKLGRQIVLAMIHGIERRPVTPSRRRHARGSMPAVEAGA